MDARTTATCAAHAGARSDVIIYEQQQTSWPQERGLDLRLLGGKSNGHARRQSYLYNLLSTYFYLETGDLGESEIVYR